MPEKVNEQEVVKARKNTIDKSLLIVGITNIGISALVIVVDIINGKEIEMSSVGTGISGLTLVIASIFEKAGLKEPPKSSVKKWK